MIARIERDPRTWPAAFLLVGGAWMVYTRLYFVLHPRGLTFDPSLFMEITGKPDPSCGLTRTFAWMWRGDVVHAVLVYPLGPLLFVAMSVTLLDAAVQMAGYPGIVPRVRLSRRQRRWLLIAVAAAVAANWTAKLLWQPMGPTTRSTEAPGPNGPICAATRHL
jgi:hypothetical protein